jgi:hypothetical protein
VLVLRVEDAEPLIEHEQVSVLVLRQAGPEREGERHLLHAGAGLYDTVIEQYLERGLAAARLHLEGYLEVIDLPYDLIDLVLELRQQVVYYAARDALVRHRLYVV